LRYRRRSFPTLDEAAMNRSIPLLIPMLAAFACAGPALAQAPAAAPAAAPAVAPPAPGATAVAHLKGGAAGMGDGEVTFEDLGAGVMVHVVATGLAPDSTHGFHVHETGVCTAPDFMSAGGHFNPTHHQHGAPTGEHHAGDIPNVVAGPDGRVDQRFMLNGDTLTGPEGLIGHSIVLHAAADDYHTQPTGNSGPRLACGVIAAP
jgi:Cu-Zn family superoxide dismutase